MLHDITNSLNVFDSLAVLFHGNTVFKLATMILSGIIKL